MTPNRDARPDRPTRPGPLSRRAVLASVLAVTSLPLLAACGGATTAASTSAAADAVAKVQPALQAILGQGKS